MNAKAGVEQTFTNSFILVSQGTAAKLIVQEFARISRGPIGCTSHGVGAPGPQVRCCQTETDSTTGITIN